ncbi:Hypothetical protein GbCGDNIH6_7286 [Granulibacter bethesdensis]|nr:Hypothetical protein GbCGDNIH6_7286 [Granulibacter bethesdensis]
MPLMVFPLLPCADDNAEDKIKKGTMGEDTSRPHNPSNNACSGYQTGTENFKKYHKNLIKITLTQM